MVHKLITPGIYALASAVCSVFFLSRTEGTGSTFFFWWLCVCVVPLLFVFAYARLLFASDNTVKRTSYILLLHGLGAIAAVIAFPALAFSTRGGFWRETDPSIGFLVIGVVVFLVASLFLLINRRSSLVVIASFLFWPYWLLLTLVAAGRFFGRGDAFFFLCSATPILLAFAAGAIWYRPKLAHITALAALLSLPWFYFGLFRHSELDNVWIAFNVPDRDLQASHGSLWYPGLAIVSVTLVALAILTAAIRLLPAGWLIRKVPLRQRTWPALVACFALLATWFSQSVMPYRIPGAVDYRDFPVLQILHVDKHGLQFHETEISVWDRDRSSNYEFSMSHNDRRLLQYRFQDSSVRGSEALPTAVANRVSVLISTFRQPNAESDEIKPVRAWNADNWYFYAQRAGLKVYQTDKGIAPPEEVVDLFRDLESLPRIAEAPSELKDVCLGFCYDPLSELGSLYSNHRCFDDGHGYHCR